MKIRKGQRLKVYHSRRGEFIGIAAKNFDTKKDKWWEIVVADEPNNTIYGANYVIWRPGEIIFCASFFTKVKKLKQKF